MKRRAGIAQLVEQRTENPRARGSSPRPGIPSNLATCGVFESSAIFRVYPTGVTPSIIPVYWGKYWGKIERD